MPARTAKVAKRKKRHNDEQDEWRSRAPTVELVEQSARRHFEAILRFAKRRSEGTFGEFEAALMPLLLTLGRLLVALFLCQWQRRLKKATPKEHERNGRRFRRAQAQSRQIASIFGKVRFWRTYMLGEGDGGYYPLDEKLRLPSDGFGLGITGLMVRIATKMSYAQTCNLLKSIFGWSPSLTTLERAVLGLGKFTRSWFEEAPVPEGDGSVLVIMIDSKATPTATLSELVKRRGKRRKPTEKSARHRGRTKRERRAAKRRRKKGDHSKNGRAATLVVMYTLKPATTPEGVRRLEGPINRWIYASYAPKRHAFAIARREANRRGFGPGSGKRIQIVMDGDNAFSLYAKEYFPEAILTLDAIHAIEYLWKAGRSFFREGSKLLEGWVAKQRDRFYAGNAAAIIRELKAGLDAIAKTGPGNKGKRKRLESTIGYLEARIDLMNYDELIKKDLEISSGPVEGAVRYVIGLRFDQAGMRWIVERSEALLQLRCIEINGQWDAFMRFVERPRGQPLELLASQVGSLPTLGSEAA